MIRIDYVSISRVDASVSIEEANYLGSRTMHLRGGRSRAAMEVIEVVRRRKVAAVIRQKKGGEGWEAQEDDEEKGSGGPRAS